MWRRATRFLTPRRRLGASPQPSAALLPVVLPEYRGFLCNTDGQVTQPGKASWQSSSYRIHDDNACRHARAA
ncbi:hypothetical protein HZ326_18158 [Fusarium oxysporum f. sp. albedinis]|nr:hypothetical protein HZ326_18158 [Fusarium oxysporum f. sp. albedinis]